ncbi:RmlC-like cupin [Hypoxylon fuscum]|nr:RmlC-like cupin [Hypoxylon fuscum]
MSGFFSLLPDLLPMIMPSEVQITKASDLAAQRDGKDAAMIRQGAVIGKSDRILMTSAGADEEPKRHDLSAGDFAFIPPWTEHQEINETDENVVWILIRSGPEPVVVYLTGWGGGEAKADSIP